MRSGQHYFDEIFFYVTKCVGISQELISDNLGLKLYLLPVSLNLDGLQSDGDSNSIEYQIYQRKRYKLVDLVRSMKTSSNVMREQKRMNSLIGKTPKFPRSLFCQIYLEGSSSAGKFSFRVGSYISLYVGEDDTSIPSSTRTRI